MREIRKRDIRSYREKGKVKQQVVRLASVYAVMDQSKTIEAGHLMAALASWEYAEQSARYIFGEATGDPVADFILGELRVKPDGLTRTEIRDLLNRNYSAERVGQALTLLLGAGLAHQQRVETGGRPQERWFAL